jgi:N-acetylmuramoyl-L-alanine amidase
MTNSFESVRKSSVLAFQKLWNRNNSTVPLDEDGMYGPRVENAMLNVSASGLIDVFCRQKTI